MSWKWIRVFPGICVVLVLFIASVFPIVLSGLISNSVRSRLDEISDMPVEVSMKFRYPNQVIAERIQWQQHNIRVSLQQLEFRVGFDLSKNSKGVWVSCDQGLGIIEVSEMELKTSSDINFYRVIEMISETIERLSDVPVTLIELSNLELEFKSPWVSEKMKINSEFQHLRTDSGCRFAIQLETPGNQVKLELNLNTRNLNGTFQWVIQEDRVHGYLEQVGKELNIPALALIEFPEVNFKFNVPVDSGSEVQFESHSGPLAFEMNNRFYEFKELKVVGRIFPSNNSFISSLEVRELQAASLGLSDFKAEIISKPPEGWMVNFEPTQVLWNEGDLGTLKGKLKILNRAERLTRSGSFDGEWMPSGGLLIVAEPVPISFELEGDKLKYSMKLTGMRQSPVSSDAGITGSLDLTKLSQSIHSTGQIDFVDLLVENVTKTLQPVVVEYALSQSSDSLRVDLATQFINHSFVSVLDRIWKITGDAALSLKRSSVSYPITANFSMNNAAVQSDLIELIGGSIQAEAEIDDSPELGSQTSGIDSTVERPQGFNLSRLGNFFTEGSIDQMHFDSGLEVVGLKWNLKSDSAIPVDRILEAEILIDRISMRDMNLNSVQISAQGIDRNLVLNGSAAFLETPIQFELKVPFSEGLQIPEQFDFKVPRFEYDQSSFSALAGISEEWFLAGDVSLSGNYRSSENEDWQSEARVHLHLESLVIPENEIVIQGLESIFKLNLSASGVVVPRQPLVFKSIEIGSLGLSDGEVDIELLPDRSLQFELKKGTFLGGQLSSSLVRFFPETGDFNGTLHFSRIELSELVKLFPRIQGRFKGSLSGSLQAKRLSGNIEDFTGYLELDPGSPASVQTSLQGLLTAGTPPDSRRFEQLKMAEKAFENLEINVLRLDFHSEPETDRAATLSLSGQAVSEELVVPVQLTININGLLTELVNLVARNDIEFAL